MNYPTWEIETGAGLLIAIVAVVHVLLSHFAIGAGLFLVVTESRARRLGDAALLGFVRRHSRFFVVASLVPGALTGVGIWFTIGLANPAGTSALIHAFVWAWAIEWTMFLVEISAALLYWYGWDRAAPRTHLAFGWVYFAAAWASLFVINGILTFMLTPGRWTQTRDFWDGLANPTYLPSAAVRSALCVALAGAFAFLTGSVDRDAALRRRVVRLASLWTLAGAAAAVPSALWYWHAADAATGGAVAKAMAGAIPAAATALSLLHALFFAALALVAVFGLLLPRLGRWPVAAAVIALLLGGIGAFEWMREGARKPWLVRGYLFANGAYASEPATPLDGGLAAHAVFVRRPEPTGEDLFRAGCRSCHTVDGYQDIRSRVAGRSEAFLEELLLHVDRMRVPMPAFRGSPAERRTLARWLAGLTQTEEIAYPEAGKADAGRAVFARDCGLCHTTQALRPRFRGQTPEDAADFLDAIPEMFEGKMPAFHGTDREKAALAAFLAAEGAR